MAWRIFGMPRLAEYRWLRGLRTASASFSTATSGEGRSGLPNPMSITSRPSRRPTSRRSLMVANTYGGRLLIRRNSMDQGYRPPSAPVTPDTSGSHRQCHGARHGTAHGTVAPAVRTTDPDGTPFRPGA